MREIKFDPAIQLPSQHPDGQPFEPAYALAGVPVEKVEVSNDVVIGTTNGIEKPFNEDRIGCLTVGNAFRLCVVDGHWGDEASQIIIDHWLQPSVRNPNSRKAAIHETIRTQNKLVSAFGATAINGFGPEAGFVAVEVDPVRSEASVVGYGDCRFIIARDGKVVFTLPTKQTWLGVFSHRATSASSLDWRRRLPVNRGLVYARPRLQPGDTMMVFTDGVDECIYEQPTISPADIAALSAQDEPAEVFDMLMQEVFRHGAEDNASLGVYRFQPTTID